MFSLFNINLIIPYLDLTVAEKADGFGEDLPLGFLHDAELERFGCVILLDFDSLLEDDGTRIAFGDDDVNRCARELDALCESGFVNVEAVESLSAEGGNERGMNVEDLVRESLIDLLVKDGHKARENDEIDVCRSQGIGESLRISGDVGVILSGENDGVDAVLCRTLKRVNAGLGCENETDLARSRFVPPPETRTAILVVLFIICAPISFCCCYFAECKVQNAKCKMEVAFRQVEKHFELSNAAKCKMNINQGQVILACCNFRTK